MDKQTIDYLKSTYPDVITKDQFYRICHISKKTASYLLDNGLVPCTNSGKQTRKYKIRLDDVIAFLDARENNPYAFKAPDNYYGHGAHNPHALNIERLMKNRKMLRAFLNNRIAKYDDVILPSAVAEITGYTLKTVSAWCEKGKLKSFNIFNRVKIPKEYLVDFLVSDEAILIAKKSTKHIDLLLDALHYINMMCSPKKDA